MHWIGSESAKNTIKYSTLA